MSPSKLREKEKDRGWLSSGVPGSCSGGTLWVVWCFGVAPAGSGLSAGRTCLGGLLLPLPDGALVLSPAQRPGTVLHPSPLLTTPRVSPDVFRILSALLPAFVASGTTQAAAPLFCLVA